MSDPDTERYQISVILTDECNMRCKYCTTAKRPIDVTTEVLQKLVHLLDLTAPARLDINYHGGEPTLVWDSIVELYERLQPLAESREISHNICTNGTGITDERARFLAERGFNVRLSIDGRRASHTLYRFPAGKSRAERTDELYDATATGLTELIRAKTKTAVNMVVTPATVTSLLDNAVHLIKQGLTHLVISPVVGMPWSDEQIFALDGQLREMTVIWRHWMRRHPAADHENLRRAILSEIDRAIYCTGDRMNQPDARVLVVGPTGRIFGDEPEARTEEALVLGHVHEVDDLADLPPPKRTAFQLMYDREFYEPHVLRDVVRTHRVLHTRMVEMYGALFGEPAPVHAG